MKSTLAAVVLATFLDMTVSAADVSGVWSLRLTTTADESAPRASVTLRQDGDKLTGHCIIDNTDGEGFTVSGQAGDKTATWRCTGKVITVLFEGAVNATGREMTGSWTTGVSKGSFKGSKPSR